MAFSTRRERAWTSELVFHMKEGTTSQTTYRNKVNLSTEQEKKFKTGMYRKICKAFFNKSTKDWTVKDKEFEYLKKKNWSLMNDIINQTKRYVAQLGDMCSVCNIQWICVHNYKDQKNKTDDANINKTNNGY